MSQSVVSILDPLSAEAVAVPWGRRAYLREIVIALLWSLSLPLVSFAGIVVFVLTKSTNIVLLAITLVTISAVTAIPALVYAGLRLNAATLARERAAFGPSRVKINKARQGPFFERRSIVAGSTRSRFVASLPGSVGFCLEFALVSYLFTGSARTFLNVPIGILLAIQLVVVTELLLRRSVSHSSASPVG